jgi:hypothetical protein
MNGTMKIIMTILGFALIVGAVSAAGGAQVVKLVEKNPADWTIVPGASGSIMYQQDKFVFNGHGLVPGKYTLISYVEPTVQVPYDQTVQVVLGDGTATKQGNLLIKGGATTGLAYNTYASDADGDYQGITGAKIWLVPASALNADGKFVEWNPDNYLFETSLII